MGFNKSIPDARALRPAFVQAWDWARNAMDADGKPLTVKVAPEKRAERHSRHYHSLIEQIGAHVGGDLSDKEDAKRVLVSAFRIDTRDDPEFKDLWARFGDMRLARGLRGETVVLGAQTRDFPDKLARAFIEWLYALGAELGVIFKAWESQAWQ